MAVAWRDGARADQQARPRNRAALNLILEGHVQPVLFGHDTRGRDAGAQNAAQIADAAQRLALDRLEQLAGLIAEPWDDRDVGVRVDESGYQELVGPFD